VARQHDINVLELMTIMVALKLWSSTLGNRRIQIYCDNMTSVNVINAGKSRDKMLLALIREIAFICAKINSQIRAIHISGQSNTLSDWLSRAPVDSTANKKLYSVIDASWQEFHVNDSLFTLENNW
jgi:ribonuclease HI